jgi:outer membrane protein
MLLVIFLFPALTIAQKNTMVLTVDEMYRLASANSKQLKLSESEIEIAHSATEVSRNALNPSIGVTASASYIGDAFLTDRDFSNYTRAAMPHFGNNFSVEASQIIFSGRAISNTISKARLDEQIAQLKFNKEQQNIRFILTSYYLDLCKLLNLKTVYLQNKKQINLLIDQIKAQQKAGMALNNDVTRHELMLQNIDLAIIETDNNCRILNNQLISTLGLPDSTVIVPDTTILFNISQITSPDELNENATKNTPEIQSADLQIQKAEKYLKISKADYLPTVALFAGDYFNGPILIEVPPINKNLNYWTAGISLKYNLSSLYSAKRNVNMAKARQNTSIAAKSVIEENISIALKNAFIKYQESFERLKSFEKSLELANQNYKIINTRYLNNMVLISEMLDASNAKLNAELQLENGKINTLFNYFNLKYISGTL